MASTTPAAAAPASNAEDIWHPKQYLLFEDMRARPGFELIARVQHTLEQFGQSSQSVRRAIDLGCGTGKLALKLASVFPTATVQGIDTSANMLESARAATAGSAEQVKNRVSFKQSSFLDFSDAEGLDLIFSNAALHWTPVSTHETVFPHLLKQLKSPGGILAVQIPSNFRRPTHMTMLEALKIGQFFTAEQLAAVWSKQPEVHDEGMNFYYRVLTGAGARHVDLWEVDYAQPLHSSTEYHPALEWTKSTALAPILAALATDADRTRFQQIYSGLLEQAYPSSPAPNGGKVALVGFKRIFMIAVM